MNVFCLAVACAAAFFAVLAPAAGEEIDREIAAASLAAAYPDFIKSASPEKIVWHDGSESVLGPVRPRSQAAQILLAPSIAEQFLFDYPLYPQAREELPREDPGRARNEAFFAKMYGDCRRGQLRGKLRTVKWLKNTAQQSITVTTVNGIDRKIEAISDEIEQLPMAKRIAAARLSGAFSCRVIAGTTRLSMHAFGAAIDLHGRVGRYWRWSGLNDRTRGVHFIPHEIIGIFERRGFIWGGNWYHVDSIHFEYRPELIEYARRKTGDFLP